jgi:16S rRNA (uracil1498-N3)-methyltransferase
MSAPRFYCPFPLSVGGQFDLSPQAARHASRVLRLRVGDSVVLFDGKGGEYSARISSVMKDSVAVEPQEWRDCECESPIRVTLVQALQAGEKMDFTIQKAVELGVSRIVPVVSRRGVMRLEGERAVRRVEHWRGVVVAACEQSGRNRVPELTELVPLERWLADRSLSENEGCVPLMLAPEATTTLDRLSVPHENAPVELLIGAEGGFAPEEMAMAERAGYVAIRLGPRVLRTETAGLAALAAIQCLWGDFRGG